MVDNSSDGSSRSGIIADAVATALIEQSHDGSRHTSIPDYAAARLDGEYDLLAVAEHAVDQLEAKSPFAFELGLLVEAFFGNDEEVAVGVSEMFPDERRTLRSALVLLNSELDKAIAASDAELDTLVDGPGSGADPA